MTTDDTPTPTPTVRPTTLALDPLRDIVEQLVEQLGDVYASASVTWEEPGLGLRTMSFTNPGPLDEDDDDA